MEAGIGVFASAAAMATLEVGAVPGPGRLHRGIGIGGGPEHEVVIGKVRNEVAAAHGFRMMLQDAGQTELPVACSRGLGHR